MEGEGRREAEGRERGGGEEEGRGGGRDWDRRTRMERISSILFYQWIILLSCLMSKYLYDQNAMDIWVSVIIFNVGKRLIRKDREDLWRITMHCLSPPAMVPHLTALQDRSHPLLLTHLSPMTAEWLPDHAEESVRCRERVP